MVHTFEFGKRGTVGLATKADMLLRESVDKVDMDEVWAVRPPYQSDDEPDVRPS